MMHRYYSEEDDPFWRDTVFGDGCPRHGSRNRGVSREIRLGDDYLRGARSVDDVLCAHVIEDDDNSAEVDAKHRRDIGGAT